MSHRQGDHVCPPWIGLVSLLNPLRRILYTPKAVLGPYLKEGMTVVEPGPGMGFFTLEAARLVGPKGIGLIDGACQINVRILAVVEK